MIFVTVPVGVSKEIHSRSLVVELEPDAGGEGHEVLLQTVVSGHFHSQRCATPTLMVPL